MGKVTSVNLDEDTVEWFKRENINISAWIRKMMERRMIGGPDTDIREFRIAELERQRERITEDLDAVDEELDRLKTEVAEAAEREEKSESFPEHIEQTAKEFITYGSAKKLRASDAFKRKAEEMGVSPFTLADEVMEYREEVMDL
ncbi:MAG: hypothetical protein RI544_07895 [Haloquadratum sp.]|nr:hypothetical protein [Haloquadratum sp.]